jgi:hypothetical protein
VSSVVRLGAMTLALSMAGGGLPAPALARAAATCRLVPTPNVGIGDNGLLGVAATSPRNASAVGYRYNDAGTQRATLIEHWNGGNWRVQPSPSPETFDELAAVAATSSANAWAVGYSSSAYPPRPDRGLIEHWNGRAWRITPSPNLGVGELYGVAVTSPDNAWAVGSDVNGTVIEHWNGRDWRLQASPYTGISQLLGVTATSPRNAWAVGYGHAGSKTLVEHWNGRVWKVQPSPSPPIPRGQAGAGLAHGVQLAAVAATSASNAWAVGYTASAIDNSGDEVADSVIEHWDGHAWRLQRSPTAGAANVLAGIAAKSATAAWAVGQPFGLGQAAIEHWNGHVWRARRGPDGELLGVAETSPTDVWAVGTGGSGTLAVHCS